MKLKRAERVGKRVRVEIFEHCYMDIVWTWRSVSEIFMDGG